MYSWTVLQCLSFRFVYSIDHCWNKILLNALWMNFLKLHLICKYEDYFFTLPDCISWWLRCKVYKNLFSPDLVQFKSKINQDVFMQIFILQRQSKLDEVLRQTGEADDLGAFQLHSLPSPHPWEEEIFCHNWAWHWSTLWGSWMC